MESLEDIIKAGQEKYKAKEAEAQKKAELEQDKMYKLDKEQKDSALGLLPAALKPFVKFEPANNPVLRIELPGAAAPIEMRVYFTLTDKGQTAWLPDWDKYAHGPYAVKHLEIYEGEVIENTWKTFADLSEAIYLATEYDMRLERLHLEELIKKQEQERQEKKAKALQEQPHPVKFCPLFSIFLSPFQKGGDGIVRKAECIEERCALWQEHQNACGLKTQILPDSY